MCGLCGFTGSDDQRIARMVEALAHRGPDDSGTFADARVTLGHTRLSVIDTSELGHQPMSTDDGGVVIAFNGEIYNFQDVRAELERSGHRFHGGSDTEVVLRGYVEWGEGVFERLNGMWAICIYDKAAGRLILCRDRMGVKPLYYTLDGGGIAFASEMAALLIGRESREIDRRGVDLLLSSQFIPSPRTIFQGISKLEPRQLLVYGLDDGSVERRYYYEIPAYAPVHDRERLVREGRALLKDAVRIRMIADVPLGAFLSGGLDSTLVVAMMREHVEGDHLHTVSAGFDIPALDESEFIEIARKRYDTVHHHIVFATSDVGPKLDAVIERYGEPVADPSSLPTYDVSREARKWMTVALSGDGGDEVFGGYPSRQLVARFLQLRRIPRFLRASAHAVLSRTVGYGVGTVGKLTEALRVSLLPLEDYFAELGASLVYRPPAFKTWARSRLKGLLERSDGNLLEAMLKFDLFYNRLGDNYCAKVDRMSMAHALEVRSPFLDYRLAEFASRIPAEWRISPTGTKELLREIAEPLVPEIIRRREKSGFAAPLGAWAAENLPELRRAVEVLTAAGVLDEPWRAFLSERVLAREEPLYVEYRKRLAILWRWYLRWGRADGASPDGLRSDGAESGSEGVERAHS